MKPSNVDQALSLERKEAKTNLINLRGPSLPPLLNTFITPPHALNQQRIQGQSLEDLIRVEMDEASGSKAPVNHSQCPHPLLMDHCQFMESGGRLFSVEVHFPLSQKTYCSLLPVTSKIYYNFITYTPAHLTGLSLS